MALVDRLREKMRDQATQNKDTYVIPEDPEKLVKWLNDHKDRGMRRQPDLQMKMNLAYVLGHQWIVWDRDKRQFRRPQWRANDTNAPIRITVNKIGGIVERTIARLLKEAPEPECRPASDDETDEGAARVGSRILDHEMDRTDWKTQLVDLYFWVTTLGYSYIHLYWDPSAGSVIGTLPAPDEAADEQAAPQDVSEGEVRIEVVPAFELAVDPNARKWDEAWWCVRTVSMTKEACFVKFGFVPATAVSGRTLVDEVYELTDKNREDRPYQDTVAVHQMWIRPGSKLSQEGLVVTWAGSTIIEQKPFPYEHGRLPFEQFDLLPGLGTREGRTWVTDLIPIQADYNDSRSREAAIRRQMVPKMLYPVGSIDPQRLTTRVEAVPYLPTGNPPSWQMPDARWQAAHETVMQRATQELGERSGMGEVSSGSAPASMPAASVMALQEADDTKMAITMKLMSKGISRVGWMWLMLVKQFWQEPRLVRTWSQEGDIEVEDFIGSDLGQQLDVHVDSESSLPKSKTARLNLLMELLQIPGMFSNPRDFLKLLDLPGISPMMATMSIDNKQAERENSRLLDGEPCRVHDFDNHAVHMQEHNDFRKSENYEKIEKQAMQETAEQMQQLQASGIDPSQIDPSMLPPAGEATQIQAAFDAHVAAHQELAMAQLQNAMMAEQQQPGAQPGEAPPPGDRMSESGINTAAGVGAPNEPGAVPGIGADDQAARMGR